MSENTSQGQGQGPGLQGSGNQPQSQQGEPGAFQGLQREQGTNESPDVATNERGQAPWTGQARERQNYQPDTDVVNERAAYSQEQPAVSTRDDEISAAVERALAERDRKHAQETAKLRNLVPQLVVPMNGGGPGNDQHQVSWNLAEQEAAARGEVLDHWEVD